MCFLQVRHAVNELPHHGILRAEDLVSGAMGPLSNAPIDTIKTRLQRTPAQPGTSAWTRIALIAGDMFKYVAFFFPFFLFFLLLPMVASDNPGFRLSEG